MNTNMLDYKDRMETEIAHYERVFKNRLTQEVPSIWNYVEEYFADCMERATGVRNLYLYVGDYFKNKKNVSILGLGSGACGNELDGILPVLRQHNCNVELTCIDINEAALKQASQEAIKRNVNFTPIIADVNNLSLQPNMYDVIVAYASLHHFLELDYITKEINNGLTEDGIFVTVDIPTRNGYKMWDETYEIINSIWKIIPPKFKIDHTGFSKPTYVSVYENIDYSINSFECINSEEILPSLRKNLIELHYVPSLSIARRFFDTKFGSNYDLSNELDLSIFKFIIQLDKYYLDTGILKPETFFGSYKKKK